MKKKITALFVVIISMTLFSAAPVIPAEASPFPQVIKGCSVWVTTYPGFMNVTIYRGHAACYGDTPKKEYRSRILCRLGFIENKYVYGGWKKEGTGKDSYNSCPWPWQTGKDDIVVQFR